MRIAVIVPALDEEQSIHLVVRDLYAQVNPIDESRIVDFLVVADNGSTDRTAESAENEGAHVVSEPQKGYGRACLTALVPTLADIPDVVVFVDGDFAFEGSALRAFLDQIQDGADLVIGSRTHGKCEIGALTISQLVGNRVATILIRLLLGIRVSDLGPYRAVTRIALEKLNMQDEAFGWTVEMQVKAIILGLNTVEIPVNTRVRLGKSKISGTLKGVVGAGFGIVTTIIALWLKRKHFNANM